VRVYLAVIGAATFLALGSADASAFSMSFRWCGTGSSPVFSLSGVPKGTTSLQFHMDDLDYSSGNHGGGTLAYNGKSSVPCGAYRRRPRGAIAIRSLPPHSARAMQALERQRSRGNFPSSKIVLASRAEGPPSFNGQRHVVTGERVERLAMA
jgi:hypothetical protein